MASSMFLHLSFYFSYSQWQIAVSVKFRRRASRIWTRGRRIEGADKYTRLWFLPITAYFFDCHFFILVFFLCSCFIILLSSSVFLLDFSVSSSSSLYLSSASSHLSLTSLYLLLVLSFYLSSSSYVLFFIFYASFLLHLSIFLVLGTSQKIYSTSVFFSCLKTDPKTSVTILGDLLAFRHLLNLLATIKFAQIFHILRQFL